MTTARDAGPERQGVAMNLYRISQDINNSYDSYDSAVVCAQSEDDARLIHPSSYDTDWGGKDSPHGGWVNADQVSVQLIGVAAEGIERGVVCASFNAG